MNQLKEISTRDFDPTANAWYTPPNDPVQRAIPRLDLNDRVRADQLHQLSLLLHQPVDEANAGSEPRKVQDANNRQYSRCPVADATNQGVLTISGRRFKCRLVELSIGGFGVEIPGQPTLKQDAVGNFRVPGMDYVVSVTRQVNREGVTFVGLKQIEEIVDFEHPMGTKSSWLGKVIAVASFAVIMYASYCFMTGK